MAFEIVKAEDRFQRMQTWFSGICTSITDFISGSVISSKFKTVAVEMEAQDFAFYQLVKKAIAVSIYNAFNFTLLPPVNASTNITFTAVTPPASNILIPAGTRVSTQATNTTAAVFYQTQSDATLLAGQTTISTTAQCTNTGTSGNTGANTITVMGSYINGINSVTNTTAVTSGSDIETEAARETRFQNYISSISRGIIAAIEYGAGTTYLVDINGNITEEVVSAYVDEPYLRDETLPAALINCYIYNGTSGASSGLVTACQNIINGYSDNNGNKIPGYKAAGVVCNIVAVTQVPTNVTAVITPTATATTAQQTQLQIDATTAIATWLQNLAVGQTLLISDLIEIIKGMSYVFDVAFSAPTGNVTPTIGQVISPSTINITVS